MVYYFTSTGNGSDPDSDYNQGNHSGDGTDGGDAKTTTTTTAAATTTFTIYMGKDKYENEHLIRYGWPEDVWFHVDDLSSAHVYLRMEPGMTLDDISEELLLDCAALVKANSIQGCKKSEVYVVYTRWKNLKKTADMVDGQVGFHRPENVRRIKVGKHNARVKQIQKTRVEKDDGVDALDRAQQNRLAEIQRQKKQHVMQQQKLKEQQRLKELQERELRSYDRLFADSSAMTAVSDQNATADASAAEAYEDDFF